VLLARPRRAQQRCLRREPGQEPRGHRVELATD
jgi:hypothetical protein